MKAYTWFTDAHIQLVNEILPGLDAIAAYRLGIGSAFAVSVGLEPTRNLLESCAKCNSVAEAVEFAQQWADHAFEQGPKKGSFQ